MPDIAKYRIVLIEMIDKRINMLDLMNLELSKSIADIQENTYKFMKLWDASRIKLKSWYGSLIADIYALNVVLECLRDGVGNGIWPKGITDDFIARINEKSVKEYYITISSQKIRLLTIAHEEIEIIRILIETNVRKYVNIIKDAGEMVIYTLDQAFADIDKTIGYIRKIIIMIPSIVEKKNIIYHKKRVSTIVSQDFGGNKYSKNIMITYVMNDKF